MKNKCCVEECGVLSQADVSYFEFPTSRLLRKRWLAALRAAPARLPPAPRLCSRHFRAADYERVRGRVRLRARVVPSLFGDQALNSNVQKDPPDPPPDGTGHEDSQESTVTDMESIDNDSHNGKVDNDNGKVDKDNGKVDNDNGKVDNDNGKVDNENRNNDKLTDNRENPSRDATENGHNIIVDNGKTDNDNGKSYSDNDNSVKNVVSKSVSEIFRSRKVRKKWVPMREVKVNGHAVSEDSSSQDSVNSEVPPAPAPAPLLDLEEHLPNYQIANLKTERQLAAMAQPPEPEEPPPEPEEEPPAPPHVPVYIELSVGQEGGALGAGEQGDCLMVLESVQCDVDPTLMLEARAEEDACCEHVDLDDDDDEPPVQAKSPPPARAADPISLLTSSDEDDVILQEPHVDTLSVSDETDEDDLPLKKLIKRERRRKKKKAEPVRSILVGAADYYCTRCQHVSASRAAHERHVRAHAAPAPPAPAARVYHVCKECGFTTASQSQLLRHQRKHLNEKRYRCPLCSYRSKYRMSLAYHLKTHEDAPELEGRGALRRRRLAARPKADRKAVHELD